MPPDLRPAPGRETVRERRIRRPAGPKPPQSWLDIKPTHAFGLQKSKDLQTRQRARILAECVDVLPELYLPEERSLMSQTLKAVARNWQWHIEYDQYCLAMLPTRLKEALVSFIARYSPQGINRHGLEIIFMEDATLEDGGDNEDVAHLDLSTSIGHSVSLRELKNFLVDIPKSTVNAQTKVEDEMVPDSWDAPSSSSISHHFVFRFPFLTHLSLSHPHNASWKSLLNLAPQLMTLTHLSLAFWPYPSLNPFPLIDNEIPLGNVSYGSASFQPVPDSWNEARAILRQLSKKTYCLKWLDLTGCCVWIWSLQCEGGVDWNGSWRRLETVKVGQGWMPDCLKDATIKFSKQAIDNSKKYAVFGFENRNSTGALATWLRYEKQIGKLEQVVNEVKSKSARKMVDHLAEVGPNVDDLVFSRDESEDWWDNPRESALWSAEPKDDGQYKRVIFERGWEGWWIDEAIKAYRFDHLSTFPPQHISQLV
ncbi:hypothetical protein MMC07_003907 [Pseudocyphellaria aurata]|nr:hypothetical protein [Pseudocyphellaria aurata]